jgi:release factor glutamine methyltransferase
MTDDTVRSRLQDAIDQLTRAGVPDAAAAADARKLMRVALDVQAVELSARLDDDMDWTERRTFDLFIGQRVARRPVSKILQGRSFWKWDFYVTDDVLDPRPDTETLVEAALSEPFVHVLDLGTGSGCILLSLLDERPDAIGTGTDISDAALEVARLNAVPMGLTGRMTLVASDWFSHVTGTFDLIVSNPPYIAEAEMAGLDPEVRDFDPIIALTPGGDGLDAYRAIAHGACAHLMPGGRILLEIGPTQARAVIDLLAASGLQDIHILPDLDGRDRVIAARAPRR